VDEFGEDFVMNKVFVIIPAHNEEELIESVLHNFTTTNYHVVVVDDGSTDNTAEKVIQSGAILIRHPINLGQGAALQTGIDYAIKHGASHIVTFDADGQHDFHDISTMLDILDRENLDIVLGSRFLGTTKNMPLSRHILLKLACWFTRMSSGLPVTDAHNGLRVFKTSVARQLRLYQPRMAHATEIIYKIRSSHLKFREVPVTTYYTEYSKKKGQRSLSGVIQIISDLLFGGIS
jgi:glycosyltransferase involved in cell wall biosynthesis